MNDAFLSRRGLLGAGLALPLLALLGCTGEMGPYGLGSPIRRLLTLASQRAFANLLRDNGFFNDPVAQVTLPAQLGGTGAASLLASDLLRQPAVRDQLLRLVNAAATSAARSAAPLVFDTVARMRARDAVFIVRGGSTAATEYLQRELGNAVFDALLPGVGTALASLDNGLLGRALQAASGIDLPRLRYDVARKASDGIYRAIGREEASIRANPRATRDPVLITAFGGLN
jgi:hypothetical protein